MIFEFTAFTATALAGSESLVQALTRLPIDITHCQNLSLSSCCVVCAVLSTRQQQGLFT
jgi:hypothetical protein